MSIEIKDTIDFEAWSKLDVRIGTITEAEPVPETDRLLKLLVDFGFEKRQIVSGIADRVEIEQIIGKQCPFILNLEPRTIRGVESNGMILAAGDDDNFALLHPNQTVDAGAKIK